MYRLDNLYLPPGRFVSGSLTEKQTTEYENGVQKPIPEEDQAYQFGIAFDKFNPDGTPGAIWGPVHEIANFAKTGYAQHPAIVARVDQWLQTMDGGFSMKMSDGDKPNARGETNPNYAGKLLMWFSTKLPPRVCDANNINIDPANVKRGWFFDFTINVALNNRTDHNAGVYLNMLYLRLIGEGDEIVGGISADAAFGGVTATPGTLPPGARPVGSTPSAPAGMPGVGQPGMTPAVPGQAPTAPAATPGLPMAGTPAQQPVMTAPAAPPTVPVATPGAVNPGAPATGVPATASPSNPPVQHPPHTAIMNHPQAGTPQPAVPPVTGAGLPQ